MARIDWAVLCDLAFMDRQDRLCVMGVTRMLPVPALPTTLHQVMLVAHVTDVQPVDEIGVAVSLITPDGVPARLEEPESIVLEMAGEYVLATLRNVPLVAEGVYRFEIELVGQPGVSIAVPVLTAGRSTAVSLH